MRRKVIFIFRSPCPLLNAQNKSQSISLSQRRISIDQSLANAIKKMKTHSRSLFHSEWCHQGCTLWPRRQRGRRTPSRGRTRSAWSAIGKIFQLSQVQYEDRIAVSCSETETIKEHPKPDKVFFRALQRLFWKIPERKRLKSGQLFLYYRGTS